MAEDHYETLSIVTNSMKQYLWKTTDLLGKMPEMIVEKAFRSVHKMKSTDVLWKTIHFFPKFSTHI